MKKRINILLIAGMLLCGSIHPSENTKNTELSPAILSLQSTLEKLEAHNIQSTIVATFLTVVKDFITIIQNPENAELISDNVADMVANIVEAATKIIQELPKNATEEQKKEYIKNMEDALTASISAIAAEK